MRDRSKFCSVCELAKVIHFLDTGNDDKQIRTSQNADLTRFGLSIDHHLYRVSSEFIPGRQQDANLFLLKLLEHMNDCLTHNDRNLSKPQSATTIIDQIFGIEIRSTVECLSCFTQTMTAELHCGLSVGVNNIHSLTDALKHFFQHEILSGQNAFECGRCRALVTGKRRLSVGRSSPILIINLKRGGKGRTGLRKLVHGVQYSDVLDISAYITTELLDREETDASLYHLYAVIVHQGVHLDSGHYIAYVRTKGNTWMMINDAHCRRVLLEDVLNHESAYTLFYACGLDLSDGSHLIYSIRNSQSKRSS